MIKDLQYLYLGDNGSILSPVKLTSIQFVKKYKLFAENGHKLTKDGINFFQFVLIPESELDQWYEV